MRGSIKNALKWALITLAVLFLAIQFVRPAKTNPPVDESRTFQAGTQMTPEVAAILDRSCNDCHSNKTVWPWYSQVAPVSWYLVRHVDDGRRHLNFSDWDRNNTKRATRKLQEICEQVETGEMPITSYLPLHPSAKLSDADKKVLCDWTTQEQARLAASQTNGKQ